MPDREKSTRCGRSAIQKNCSKSGILSNMIIREAIEKDFDAIWPIFNEVVSAGETYAYPRETTKSEALKIWMQLPRKTYVAEEDNHILGTYYIKTNQAGPGVMCVIVDTWCHPKHEAKDWQQLCVNTHNKLLLS